MGETLVWQTFLGLALRRASYITQIRLQMPGDPTGDFRHILFTPGSNPDANPRVLRRDVLFFRSTLGSDLESVLANWNSLYEKADKAIQLFAGVDYQGDAFYSTKLLSYLQCLEVLHRELYPEESPFLRRTSGKRHSTRCAKLCLKNSSPNFGQNFPRA